MGPLCEQLDKEAKKTWAKLKGLTFIHIVRSRERGANTIGRNLLEAATEFDHYLSQTYESALKHKEHHHTLS